MPDACKLDPLGQSFHEKPGKVHLENLAGKAFTTAVPDKQYYLTNYNLESADQGQKVVTVFIEGIQTTGAFSAYSKTFLKENLPHAVFTIPGMSGDPNQAQLFTAPGTIEKLKGFLAEIPKRLCQKEVEIHLVGFSLGGTIATTIAADSEFLKKSGLKFHGADLISPGFNTHKVALDIVGLEYSSPDPRPVARAFCRKVMAPWYIGLASDDISIRSYKILGNKDSEEAKQEVLFTPTMPPPAACEAVELMVEGRGSIKKLGALKSKFTAHLPREDKLIEYDNSIFGMDTKWWNDGHLLVRNHREALTKLIIENLRK